MSRILTHSISIGLIGGGVVAWVLAGHSLATNPDLKNPPNPLGINGSPYGEVFAMAAQGPIDTYFHEATGAGQHSHHHAEGEECDCEHHEGHETGTTSPSPSLEKRFDSFLFSLAESATIRTNPRAASNAHKLYLRRQVEDKLRFAYQLDPAHYANYTSLHFFLTEGLGTRPHLTPSAAKLAEDTIQYCLKQENDPRPALTAAAAASNMLHLMFADQLNQEPKFSTAQMRQCLNLLDHCLARYQSIARQWDESGNWKFLSPQRIAECSERLHFIGKIRDAAEKTLIRYEGKFKAS